MAYQSLYRRYRPQTFAEIRGQPHLVAALRNAVARGEVGHAYLLHGPRGTGKTSTARVLAKALNCETLSESGEPCGACDSCTAIEQGRSFDLHELDAAGNNRVEDMRALLAKVSLGTPGRVKVYVLDEVHMLTPAAENALLKTLEEPPDHVVWVLATTEPHKVVDTIRSRCQEFELSLLGAQEMAEHVRWVAGEADLGVGPEVVDHVVSAGGGSVRDTLSALDRVVAAGGMGDLDTSTDSLLEAIAAHDAAAALSAIGDAARRGRDPRAIGEGVLAGLRDAFLVAMGAPPPQLTPSAAERASRIAEAMAPARITSVLDALGRSLVEMRHAPDPRVDIEVTLVRLCRHEPERSAEELAEELERLARRVERLEASPSAARPAESPPPAVKPLPAKPAARPAGPPDREPPPVPRVPPPANVGRGDPAGLSGPAAARRALADNLSESATTAGRAAAPQPASSLDPAAERPKSPSEVVHLAHRLFGMAQGQVIERAKEMFGPAKAERTQEELDRLWQAIVESQTSPYAAQEPAAPQTEEAAQAEQAAHPAVPQSRTPAPDAAPDPRSPSHTPPPNPAAAAGAEPGHDEEEIDLEDLVDAPDRVGILVSQIQEQFPGAKHHPAEEQPG